MGIIFSAREVLLNQGFKAVDMSVSPQNTVLGCFNGSDYCKVIDVPARETVVLSKNIVAVLHLTEFYLKSLMLCTSVGLDLACQYVNKI